jgi:hypothetical protein
MRVIRIALLALVVGAVPALAQSPSAPQQRLGAAVGAGVVAGTAVQCGQRSPDWLGAVGRVFARTDIAQSFGNGVALAYASRPLRVECEEAAASPLMGLLDKVAAQ